MCWRVLDHFGPDLGPNSIFSGGPYLLGLKEFFKYFLFFKELDLKPVFSSISVWNWNQNGDAFYCLKYILNDLNWELTWELTLSLGLS